MADHKNVLAELARVKAVFQLRAISAAMGFGPTAIKEERMGIVDIEKGILEETDTAKVAKYAVAVMKRIGQLGEDATAPVADALQMAAGDPEFESGYEVINT